MYDVNPSEVISFFLIGMIILVIIFFVWILFRKRKKWAAAITMILVIGYVSYYFYYPVLKVNTHAKRYEQLTVYLTKNYPNRQFNIEPIHYEEGYRVGDFQVNDVKSPNIGVTLRVDDKGQVKQLGTWSKNEYRHNKSIFSFRKTYTLDKEIPKISKQDEWIDGELTVFALMMDDLPAIAIFQYYSSGDYKFLELQQGEQEGFVSLEKDDYLFIYIDERYRGEKVTIQKENGEEYSVNAVENKGRLFWLRNE